MKKIIIPPKPESGVRRPANPQRWPLFRKVSLPSSAGPVSVCFLLKKAISFWGNAINTDRAWYKIQGPGGSTLTIPKVAYPVILQTEFSFVGWHYVQFFFLDLTLRNFLFGTRSFLQLRLIEQFPN